MCILRRLEFKGNVFTKDKVIRREMLLREGDIFRLALFKNSVLRVKQLGLVDVEKDPDVKPDADDPTQFDVTMQVKELQRNNIQFTAGYSGYEGTFVAVTYSTVNFLGAGENLEMTAQYGKRVKNYSLRLHRALRLRQADQPGIQHLQPLFRLSLSLQPEIPRAST